MPHLAALFLVITCCGAAAPAEARPRSDVKGEWFTDAEQALATARKSRRPVLAVAMDHG